MGLKGDELAVLFLALNLLFFSLVNAKSCPCSTPPTKPKTPPSPKPNHPPKINTPPSPKPTPAPSTPKTPPTPIAIPPSQDTCPRDNLKLDVCANLLSGLIGVVVGTPSESPCCSLLQGLTGLEAVVCLCTAIKANILGINLNVDVSLSLLLNACGYKVPSGFQCG